jgi:hypothetical protein
MVELRHRVICNNIWGKKKSVTRFEVYILLLFFSTSSVALAFLFIFSKVALYIEGNNIDR